MKLALATTLALLLTACSGGSSTTPSLTSSTSGYVRFVNGSADSGAVDIYVDGTLSASDTDVAYGGITAYQKFSTGSHAVKVVQAGTQTVVGTLSSASVGVNGATYYSVVLTGETHPSGASNPPNLLTFTDTVYSSGSGQAAVNFHNAASAVGTAQQFGYYSIVTPTTNATLGNSEAVGGATGPQGIPTGVAGTLAIGLYAGSASSITVTPSQISTSCGTNIMPCDSGNLSLYLIDGPAASTSAVAGPYPQGITAAQTAGFVGIFDANGT
ncbi:MAG TPA: DUF4397 domain-containing protein [Candidatus Baltobacteraceae bacterium]|nr:DUF4397 domain-containing protein [Candidatus Baltobacteraceae bacterium]